jgi:hypothetical protein
MDDNWIWSALMISIGLSLLGGEKLSLSDEKSTEGDDGANNGARRVKLRSNKYLLLVNCISV